jgi:hypothetical protein
MTRSRRLPHVGLFTVGLLGIAVTFGGRVRADEAACIAASEDELTLRKTGKLQAALKALALCAQPKCSSEVRVECTKRIVELQAALPSIVFAATDESGDDLGSVSVTLDGALLTTSLDGKAVTLDPGPHTLRFEASGMRALDKQVIVREGEKDRRVSVVLQSTSPPAMSSPSAIAVESAPPSPSTSVGSWNGRKTIAIATGVVGLGGVALGSAFGLLARSEWSSSQSLCAPGACPSQSAHAAAIVDQESASTKALVSTVAFGVGVAGIAGAIVLWLTAPSAGSANGKSRGVWVSPIVGVGCEGVLMGSKF